MSEVAEKEDEGEDEPERKLTEVELVARALGWNPDYKGKRAKTAEEYLSISGHIDLRKQVEQLKRENAQIKGTFSQFRSFVTEQAEAKNAQLTRLRAQLQGQRADAIVALDRDKIVQIDKDLSELDKHAAEAAAAAAAPPPEPQTDPGDTPEARAFRERNSDWLNVPRFEAQAIQIGNVIRFKDPDLTPTQYYGALEGEVRAYLDEIGWKSRKRPGVSSVESETERGGKRISGKHTFADLPPEAKAAYAKQARDFEGSGQKFTKEDYVKFYKWDD